MNLKIYKNYKNNILSGKQNSKLIPCYHLNNITIKYTTGIPYCKLLLYVLLNTYLYI